MVLGRLALGALVLVCFCAGVSAQTQIVSFEKADRFGAFWQVVKPLAGCQVSQPRDAPNRSAVIDIDCRQFTPGTGSMVLRLFSRMVAPSVWVVGTVDADFVPTEGPGATTKILRPMPGSVGATRNLWTEIEFRPYQQTRGTLRVLLKVEVTAASMSNLPAVFPNCPRDEPPPGLQPVVFTCASNGDCAAGYLCSAACGMTCIRP
jgi:hypothetical protein